MDEPSTSSSAAAAAPAAALGAVAAVLSTSSDDGSSYPFGALPSEVVKHIFEFAASQDAATAVKFSSLSHWSRAAVKTTLHSHFRILHVSERTVPRFLDWLTGPNQDEVRNNVRALAIDHSSFNIFDDAHYDQRPEEQWPDWQKIKTIIGSCSNAKLVFLDTASAHNFADHSHYEHVDALTICAAQLPPDEHEWQHMPFPPVGCVPYRVQRLHLCPLGASALNFRALPVSLDASHLAITYPVMANRAPPGHPGQEYISRQVVLTLLRQPTFKRLVIRGSPHMLLRIVKQLLAPPQHFHFVLDPEMDEVELFEAMHDGERLMTTDRVRLRLWPKPDADPALFTPNYQGDLVFPQMYEEWKEAASIQLNDEDDHDRGIRNAQPAPRNLAASLAAGKGRQLDPDADDSADEFEPKFGAPWDDEDGDLCGITQATSDALEHIIAQYPQYHPLPPNPWLSALIPLGNGPIP
ncbi:hypothetical protein V8E36_009161 [Tilletia maclaganii]